MITSHILSLLQDSILPFIQTRILPLAPFIIPTILLSYYLIPYLSTNKAQKGVPGPLAAKFSNLWLLWQCRHGRRFLAVDEAHKKYGTYVRIQPNHVSVADAEALPLIYGHGNGFLKSDFYDAFVSIRRGLFNTRDRAEHTRKRKIVSHTFSPKSVNEFEPYIRDNLTQFVKQWDHLCTTKEDGSTSSTNEYRRIDALHHFNYLAFDIIGDLAFGAPFGMVKAQADVAEVRSHPDLPPTYAPAIEVLNRRGEVSATIGCLPRIKPYAAYLPDPFFRNGVKAVQNLAGIAVARVKDRLENAKDTKRKDLLSRLMEGRDEFGNPMGREELTAEALTQLIAGSDTTSNTSCAIFFHLLKSNRLAKLQEELDRAIPGDTVIPLFSAIKDLPYLNACIKETLRIHSTSSLGLPRMIPPGKSLTIGPYHFPEGTVLSVPTYTIHHSKKFWGDDAEEYNPERWEKIEGNPPAFNPFSTGPRACVGRNVAEMELVLIVATVARRYDMELYEEELKTREGFLRKPLGCQVGIRLREEFRGEGIEGN